MWRIARCSLLAIISIYVVDFVLLAQLGPAAKSSFVMGLQLVLLVIAPLAVFVRFAHLWSGPRASKNMGAAILELVVMGTLWWILFESYLAALRETERVRSVSGG
jgi:hypothetical protein